MHSNRAEGRHTMKIKNGTPAATPGWPRVVVNAAVRAVAPMKDPAVSAIASPLKSNGKERWGSALTIVVTILRTATGNPKPAANTMRPAPVRYTL